MTTSAVKFHETRASVLLDLMRGGAALVVLVSHWRDLLFVPYADSLSRSLPVKLFYALTGGGHQAVIVFFVLSGYLITSTIARAHRAGRWSWLVYLEHRLARLWTVLVPALLLIFLLDLAGSHLHRSAPLYFGTHAANMLLDAHTHLGILTLLGNLFFVQQILTTTYGSDGALWSLSYEFWYYILFPLLLALAAGSWKRRVVSAILALGVALFIGKPILLLFPVWLMGSLLNYVPPPKAHPRLLAALCLLYLPLVFGRSQAHPLLFQYLLGAATAAMIWLVLGLRTRAPQAVWARGSRMFAGFSYSLYVVHSPILVLATGLWLGVGQQQANLRAMAISLPWLLVSLALCYSFAWGTEFHTDAVRQWMGARLQFLSSLPSLPSLPKISK